MAVAECCSAGKVGADDAGFWPVEKVDASDVDVVEPQAEAGHYVRWMLAVVVVLMEQPAVECVRSDQK